MPWPRSISFVRYSTQHRTAPARSRATTTTPSSSAAIVSPGSTHRPAQMRPMLTLPSVSFTVPKAASRSHGEPSVGAARCRGSPRRRPGRVHRGSSAPCRVAPEMACSRGRSRRDHEDVAGLAVLDSYMDHRVDRGCDANSDGRARDCPAAVDRAQLWIEYFRCASEPRERSRRRTRPRRRRRRGRSAGRGVRRR
jgi:hypothetical protein